MPVQTEREPQEVGELIRFWRTQRRLTQMELASDANVSNKHVHFVETGRSRPSRQLLVHLAQHLDLPIAEQPPPARRRLCSALSRAALRRGNEAAAARVAQPATEGT